MKLLLVILIFLNSIFVTSNKRSTDSNKNNLIVEELFENIKFKKWIDFWKLNIPELKDYNFEESDTIKRKYSSKIDLAKWFNEREFRNFTLNYSSDRTFVLDVYTHVGFEHQNDTIYSMGGDVDPSFVIINTKDSTLYYLTFGPYAFFDESIWLSDSICYILGFSFYDSRKIPSEAYSSAFILKWDFNKNSLVLFKSKKLPYDNKLMSFQTYMSYLHPNIKKFK